MRKSIPLPMSYAKLPVEPPADTAQANLPVVSSLATNTSTSYAFLVVSVVLPKVAVPMKSPVM